MKIALFYMSITGNTKFIAEIIKKGVEESGNSCDLFNIHELDLSSIQEYDLCGFGAPVFAYREPTPIQKFILALKEPEGKYAFLFCTCEGSFGNFFFRMANFLAKKSIAVFSKEVFYCPSSYLIWPRKFNHFKPDEIKKAVNYGKSLTLDYHAITEANRQLPKVKQNVRAAILAKFMSDWALRWYLGTINVDYDKCTQCGICANICPTNAIELAPFPRISKKACIGCCGCINNCPTRALDSKKSQGKSRYVFAPNVNFTHNTIQ
ncbi:MAG TPA: EFR1 family ferrodoxin [Candidatus Deferrimicrobium sp.]|nr:EFR1 family ferrodoxin [Candidatus Deferrimicrobium sp.]